MNLEPQHPLPPGARIPDLNLAGADGLNVASGHGFQPMPDPGRPAPYVPELHGSPDLGGIDPAQPIPRLNLAGVDGVPAPAQLARPAPAVLHQPDYGAPNMTQPSLQMTNVADDGVSFEPRTEFEPDPLLPDLDEYARPYGLDIHNVQGDGSDLLTPDPLLGDLLDYDVPGGVAISRDPLAPDPLLPDLQAPQLSQEVHMSERPGDLAAGALDQMHLSPTYQQLGGVPYSSVFMDQSGMNSARRRHFDLLMGGLDDER
jgi:hypothetical protein